MEPRRAHALVVVVFAAVVLGVVTRFGVDGDVPAVCMNPVRRDGLVVCDGVGDDIGAAAWMFGGKLDLNTADATALARIRGIGPSLANKIIAARALKGGFTSLADLDDVDGVGPKMLEKLSTAVEVKALPK